MLYDAHNHLHDGRLDPWRENVLKDLADCGISEMVVNGTCESDWPAVAELARQHSWVKPSFGLHPWFVKERNEGWKERLAGWLREFPQAAVGEIGLDRWIENPDVETQVTCLRDQLVLAKEMQRPVTIHCLRAWGLLEEELRTQPMPERGFLLHSYGGPVEMISGFVKKGAYFSLSPYFGHARKAAQLAVFQEVPLDRLLAETDAPDMRPPEGMNPHPLGGDDEPLNHPANLKVSYELLAKLHGLPMKDLTGQLEKNYRRLFG
jgi:TatD DNase family protein